MLKRLREDHEHVRQCAEIVHGEVRYKLLETLAFIEKEIARLEKEDFQTAQLYRLFRDNGFSPSDSLTNAECILQTIAQPYNKDMMARDNNPILLTTGIYICGPTSGEWISNLTSSNRIEWLFNWNGIDVCW